MNFSDFLKFSDWKNFIHLTNCSTSDGATWVSIVSEPLVRTLLVKVGRLERHCNSGPINLAFLTLPDLHLTWSNCLGLSSSIFKFWLYILKHKIIFGCISGILKDLQFNLTLLFASVVRVVVLRCKYWFPLPWHYLIMIILQYLDFYLEYTSYYCIVFELEYWGNMAMQPCIYYLNRHT